VKPERHEDFDACDRESLVLPLVGLYYRVAAAERRRFSAFALGRMVCLSDLCGSICKFGPLDFDKFLWMKIYEGILLPLDSDLYLMCILFSH
jgi:hypothetical protein